MSFDLKAWRNSLNLTQEGAATLLGVHRVTYTRWETGAQPLPKMISMACLSFKQILKQDNQNRIEVTR